MHTDHDALLNILFNVSLLVFVVSTLVSLIARFVMKRKRMAAKASLVMLAAGTVGFSATAAGNYLDGASSSTNIVGVFFVVLMLLGMHSTWKKLKTLTD